MAPAARTPVDLLKEGEDEVPNYNRGLVIAAVVAMCFLSVVVWAVVSRPSIPEDAAAPSSTQDAKDFVAQRAPASPPTPSTPQNTVFLPEESASVSLPTVHSRADLSSHHSEYSGSSATVIHTRVELNGGGDGDSNTHVGPPAVRIASGLLTTTTNRRCIGKVAIANTTEGNVVDFRLSAEIAGKTYALQPFEGSPEKPRPYASQVIHAGEKLTMPVRAIGYTGPRRAGIVTARIKLEAWLDSGPSLATDEVIAP